MKHAAAAATATLVAHYAPPRLLRHNELVLEAAELLMAGYRRIGCWSETDGSPRTELFLDEELVRIGVVFHDAGKIIFREELDGDGDQHERHGASMLLNWGLKPKYTEFCDLTYRYREEHDLSLEQWTVGLADKLWRGERDEDFEERAITAIVEAATGSIARFTDWWVALDSLFESIADGGHERLERSRV